MPDGTSGGMVTLGVSTNCPYRPGSEELFGLATRCSSSGHSKKTVLIYRTGGWESLGGTFTSELVATSWGPNRVDYFGISSFSFLVSLLLAPENMSLMFTQVLEQTMPSSTRDIAPQVRLLLYQLFTNLECAGGARRLIRLNLVILLGFSLV